MYVVEDARGNRLNVGDRVQSVTCSDNGGPTRVGLVIDLVPTKRPRDACVVVELDGDGYPEIRSLARLWIREDCASASSIRLLAVHKTR